jgi:hypothetical protein
MRASGENESIVHMNMTTYLVRTPFDDQFKLYAFREYPCREKPIPRLSTSRYTQRQAIWRAREKIYAGNAFNSCIPTDGRKIPDILLYLLRRSKAIKERDTWRRGENIHWAVPRSPFQHS